MRRFQLVVLFFWLWGITPLLMSLYDYDFSLGIVMIWFFVNAPVTVAVTIAFFVWLRNSSNKTGLGATNLDRQVSSCVQIKRILSKILVAAIILSFAAIPSLFHFMDPKKAERFAVNILFFVITPEILAFGVLGLFCNAKSSEKINDLAIPSEES